MILYEVKLICPQTQKVIFSSLNKKPVLPPQDLLKLEPKPLLVINTRDSAGIEKLKKTG
jgi:hypothetical protein